MNGARSDWVCILSLAMSEENVVIRTLCHHVNPRIYCTGFLIQTSMTKFLETLKRSNQSNVHLECI